MDFDLENINETRETWKDIPSYEGVYEISNFGNVRRASDGPRGAKKGKVLKAHLLRGRASVTLSKDGILSKVYLATLVGELFRGEAKRAHVWTPIDKDPFNCDFRNLEQVAYQRGERNGNAKLTKAQKEKIKKSKKDIKQLAKQYEVSPALIYKIKKHLTK